MLLPAMSRYVCASASSERLVADHSSMWQLVTYDIHTLHLWYQHTTRGRCVASCGGSSSSRSCVADTYHRRQRPSLVVMVEEYETFDTGILSDLITMAGEYVERLPLTFVIGVATSMEAVHQGLTKHVLSKLRMTKFKMEQPGSCLDIIFRQVCRCHAFSAASATRRSYLRVRSCF